MTTYNDPGTLYSSAILTYNGATTEMTITVAAISLTVDVKTISIASTSSTINPSPIAIVVGISSDIIPSSSSISSIVVPDDVTSNSFLYFDSDRHHSGTSQIYAYDGKSQLVYDILIDEDYHSTSPNAGYGSKLILIERKLSSYSSDDNTQNSIWTMEADGSGLNEVIGVPSSLNWLELGDSTWSHDGSKLMIYFKNNSAAYGIAITDILRSEASLYYPSGVDVARYPSWDPIRSDVVFIGDGDVQVFTPEFSTTPSVTNISNDADSIDGGDPITTNLYPQFSPFNTKLVWIARMRPTEEESEQATPVATAAYFDAAKVNGTYGIRMSDVDGSNKVTIFDDDNSLLSGLQWSLDGKLLYVSRSQYGGSGWKLYSIDPFDPDPASTLTPVESYNAPANSYNPSVNAEGLPIQMLGINKIGVEIDRLMKRIHVLEKA